MNDGPGFLVNRVLMPYLNEAALMFEQGGTIDAALIFGIGFPPFRGGLLKYADTIGAKAIVEKLEGYTRKYGERFAPPASLVDMAST